MFKTLINSIIDGNNFHTECKQINAKELWNFNCWVKNLHFTNFVYVYPHKFKLISPSYIWVILIPFQKHKILVTQVIDSLKGIQYKEPWPKWNPERRIPFIHKDSWPGESRQFPHYLCSTTKQISYIVIICLLLLSLSISLEFEHWQPQSLWGVWYAFWQLYHQYLDVFTSYF